LPLFPGKRGASTLIPALLPLREKGSDGLDHRARIIQRLLIAEPNDPIAFSAQPSVPDRVVQFRLGKVMPTSIEFDDETRAKVREIGDVTTDRDLPPKPEVQL